jgi:hypothetical protein
MPISVTWDNEDKTILRMTVVERWTWDEYFASAQQARNEISTVDHPVDIIGDMLRSGPVPLGMPIRRFRFALDMMPANFRKAAIVGGSPFTKSLMIAFMQIYKKASEKMVLTQTIDEAYAALSAPTDTTTDTKLTPPNAG